MTAAFNAGLTSQINENIKKLYRRRRMVGKLTLTFDEYLATFVPEEAREAFRSCAGWIKPQTYSQHWNYISPSGEKVEANLRMREIASEAPPRYAPPIARHLAIQSDAPPEIVERIHQWAEHGGDASREFGRVRKVFDVLNTNFSRVSIRYFWPTILALCAEDGATKTVAVELQDLRAPTKFKPLPSGLLKACRQTAETIASARLIPTDIEEPDPGEVTVDIITGQKYTEDFGYFYGME